jgi:hypothetical protein
LKPAPCRLVTLSSILVHSSSPDADAASDPTPVSIESSGAFPCASGSADAGAGADAHRLGKISRADPHACGPHAVRRPPARGPAAFASAFPAHRFDRLRAASAALHAQPARQGHTARQRHQTYCAHAHLARPAVSRGAGVGTARPEGGPARSAGPPSPANARPVQITGRTERGGAR